MDVTIRGAQYENQCRRKELGHSTPLRPCAPNMNERLRHILSIGFLSAMRFVREASLPLEPLYTGQVAILSRASWLQSHEPEANRAVGISLNAFYKRNQDRLDACILLRRSTPTSKLYNLLTSRL